MRLISSIRGTDQTPEGVFANKYAWLMRWAMHFSRNDRSIAEDLVQDAFVRMLLSWEKLHSLHDLDPLLYSYLRYAHLTGLRKGNNYVFQSLSTVDSDTLAISLRVSNSFDQIEVQNELRSILHYLLWRKDSAKFASIFLLRFFHGFYPEEIAAICVATRHSIDLSLRHARGELKSYLLDPHSIEIPGRKRLPDLQHPNIAVPAHEFVHELRQEMFQGARESCPSFAELERNYRSAFQRSMDSSFLAHIVTCEPCLDKVTRICGAPPPSSRSMEDSLGAASRSKQAKKSPSGEKATVARVITESKRRFRDILEHHPAGLMIALNGEVLAVRDVSSRRASLKVEVHAVEKLELIEIFSEQRMLLLTLPLLENPPMHSPLIKHEVCLSADRTLTLHVDFTCDGTSVEAIYEDPNFTSEALSLEEAGLFPFLSREGEMANIESQTRAGLAEAGPRTGQRLRGTLSRWRNLVAPMRLWQFASLSGCAIAAACTGIWFHNHQAQEQIRFESTLQRVVQAEKHPASTLAYSGHAAVHRRLEIHATNKLIGRDLYSDTAGHRRSRQHALNQDELALKAKLDEANLDWNDPLTAASFQSWHDGLGNRVVDSQQDRGNLIVMTSAADSGSVRLESLTVRSSDFHPVARKVVLKDGESIDIAEVAFDVVSWDRVNPDWFEPVNSATHLSPPTGSMQHHIAAPLQLTEGEIDLAALGVLKALQDMHADTERLEINRTRHGVEVTGVVESVARKQELQTRLKAIAHVKPEIFSYQELDAKNVSTAGTQQLSAVSVTSADSQLDLHCRALQIAHDECQRWSYRLLSSTTALMRDSRRLLELQLQYPTGKSLTSDARTMLASLVAGHVGHLNSAIWDQQQALQTLQLWPESPSENEDAGSNSLADAAAKNQASIRELVYASNAGARPATAIVRDLAHSLKQARNAISHMPTYAADQTAMSSGILTPQE